MMIRKKIVLGITGSIAAYKAPFLIRQLREQYCDIKVVLTASAKEFVTPLTLQCLSGNPVHETLLDPAAEMAMGHIELARWADLILIAPASAHCIAKLAHGFADDLLSTICLVAQCPIILAPAMNQQMWLHAATQTNVELLQKRGVSILGPTSGEQACGEMGLGRMLEPGEIVTQLGVCNTSFRLRKPRVLITAGATQEAIDPVRYISNHSSGKMGYCLAEAFAARGADVTLVSAPTHLKIPAQLKQFIWVISAQDMLEQVLANMHDIDIMISAAAIADYRPEQYHTQKIKKNTDSLEIKLAKNQDVLQAIRADYPNVFLVGFALETENLLANAAKKLNAKKLDMIIANQLNDENPVFDADENAVTVLLKNCERIEYAKRSKVALAGELVELISASSGAAKNLN